ncbi:uracil-xanthine permease family protein [Pseudonocardia endophytica]|uniref:Uracil-xanthine permease n=1 Tax=Pseudonocardia endophytica TaxID=401976 RepID=A0A4R1HPH5_PSEEN|nr:solute carrier family 23 protein [Pseudonocardia endophytica]TCK22565.1 uracil-xanthine permease [Pseudonocardia endophytica]
MAGWTLVHGGKAPPPGEVVAPDERLSWPRTVGLGGQHVVAMFGATFVFPVIMGLNPNIAILVSGVATALFLLIVRGRVPSYLGTSASFVGGVAAIRAQGGDSAAVTGAILVAGVVLLVIGLVVHRLGAHVVTRVLPPAVTGAVVMLIGFNLATVAATVYWPQDQWAGLVTMVVVIAAAVLLPGFWGRIGVLIGLVVGFAFSFLMDAVAGPITAPDGGGDVSTHPRVDLSTVGQADWVGLPPATMTGPDGQEIAGWHLPTFSWVFVLLVLPSVIALVAENTGHVKAVQEMTRADLDPYLGRALAGDGLGTALAGLVGGSPTTTYAENIGVMAATRVYSTAAYWVAAAVAVVLGFCPKFGAVVVAVPGGVLGGLTVVLYGMVGLLGAKIWVQNRVDLGHPATLIPLAAGLIIGIGGVTLTIGGFELSGIAFGTIVLLVAYHGLRAALPRDRRPPADGPDTTVPGADTGTPDGPGSDDHSGRSAS